MGGEGEVKGGVKGDGGGHNVGRREERRGGGSSREVIFRFTTLSDTCPSLRVSSFSASSACTRASAQL